MPQVPTLAVSPKIEDSSSGSPLRKAAPIPRAVGKEGGGQENQTDGLLHSSS